MSQGQDSRNQGDGGEDAGEFVTVTEAARRLGVTVPRLRRTLARAPWREQVQEREHATRTGTRTALTVPVSVLDRLGAELSENGAPAGLAEPEREQKRERVQERAQNRNKNGNRNDGETGHEGSGAALAEQLRGEVAYLRDALNREQSLHMIALQALAQEQQRTAQLEAQNAKLIEALPSPTTPTTSAAPAGQEAARDRVHLHQGQGEALGTDDARNTPQEAPGSPESDGTGAGGGSGRAAVAADAASPQRSRPWWKFWE